MLTIADLLRELNLSVLTGAGALHREIHGLQSSDLIDPTPWLAEAEVLLSSARVEAASQHSFIKRLAAHRVAAVGIGLGFGYDCVPEGLVRAAAEHGLPLFEVPRELPFIAISRMAAGLLADAEHAGLRWLAAQQERLSGLCPSQGIGPLLEALSQILGADALLLGKAGQPLAVHDGGSALGEAALTAVRREIGERARRGDNRTIAGLGDDGVATVATPIHAGAAHRTSSERCSPDAWLLVGRRETEPSPFERAVLAHAAAIAAVEVMRCYGRREARRRDAAEVLSRLLAEQPASPQLVERLTAFGLSGSAAAVVLRTAEGHNPAPSEIEPALASALRRESAAGLVSCTDAIACALVPGLPDEEVFALAGRLGGAVRADLGDAIAVGAGRAVELPQLAQAVDEARRAIDAASLAVAGAGDAPEAAIAALQGRVATFRDLGSFGLLLALQDGDALKRFCESILGPIEAMESSYGGELLRSLRVFIETNGQWERAARKLYCHRHTLRYRIRKIEELTGRDLESAVDRIEFYLALRARGLVH